MFVFLLRKSSRVIFYAKYILMFLLLSSVVVGDECEWHDKQLVLPYSGGIFEGYKNCPDWEEAEMITEGFNFRIKVCKNLPVRLFVDTTSGLSDIRAFFEIIPNDSDSTKIRHVRGYNESFYIQKAIEEDSCIIRFYISHGLHELKEGPLKQQIFPPESKLSGQKKFPTGMGKLSELLKASSEKINIATNLYIHVEDSNGKLIYKKFPIRLQLPLSYVSEIEYH
jgi:hypothetical protein